MRRSACIRKRRMERRNSPGRIRHAARRGWLCGISVQEKTGKIRLAVSSEIRIRGAERGILRTFRPGGCPLPPPERMIPCFYGFDDQPMVFGAPAEARTGRKRWYMAAQSSGHRSSRSAFRLTRGRHRLRIPPRGIAAEKNVSFSCTGIDNATLLRYTYLRQI